MCKMKDSGIEWIGIIPENWEVCRIKDKYNLITGFTPDTARDDFYDDENGYTWISIADMTKEGKNITESTAGISNIYIRSKHPEIVRKGSLLYSFKLSVGKVGFAQKELYTNEAIASFQENDEVCLEYLYYASFLIEENANINIYGAKILNQDLINNSITIFPPLKEQQLIANFLNDKVGKVDEILIDLNNQVEILQKYKKSVITQVVTKGLNPDVMMKDSGVEQIGLLPKEWEIKPIKYLCTMQPAVNKKGLRNEDLVSFLPMDHVKNGYFINDESLLENNNNSYTEFNNGDIIMAKVTPCFENGNIAIVDNLYNGFGFGSSELFVFRANNEVCNKKYLFYWLQNDHFIKTATVNMTGAAGLKRVPAYFISHYCVAVPSLKEQQEISDYLDDKCAKIDELIKDKQTQIEKMEKYKKSLIYEYVTGKKRVKGV